MYLRDTDFPTLEDVFTEATSVKTSAWSGSSTDPALRLYGMERSDEDQSQMDEGRIGTLLLGDREVRLDQHGLGLLAGFYNVPGKFLGRIPPDEQHFIMDHRIQRGSDTPLVIRYNKQGLTEVYPTTQRRISQEALIEGLFAFMPAESKVTDWWNTPEDFRIDVIVPEGHQKIVGDRQVGDLSHGGIRIGQNRKQNLAPWVQPFIYRLACTNGMEVPVNGLKIEARGASAADVEMLLMAEARRAFDRVDHDMKKFYELRSIPADADYTGLFSRWTRDLGLPDRTRTRMGDTIQDELQHEENITMFHLVNHITNQANDPNLERSGSSRRALQRAGGQMMTDYTSEHRCPSCHSRLGH